MLQVSKPQTGPEEEEALLRVLRSGYLGQGPETAAFESELKSFLARDDLHVVCVSSGTAALHLSLEALSVGPGDEVLVPSLTFVASFQAVSATGARAIACDVRLKDGLLDLDDAARKCSSRTKAVMPVHFASLAHDRSELFRFAERFGLRVIEDAAHSFGGRFGSEKIGTQGDITCFSFDPIKNITSGEGGCVVTKDLKIAKQVRTARKLGIENGRELEIEMQGWRYHMSDLMAALGRVQLRRFSTELEPQRIRLWQEYQNQLSGHEEIRFLDMAARYRIVPHILVIRVLNGKREMIRSVLNKQGFETKIHYPPNHLLPKYRLNESLPAVERLSAELLTLPLHPEMNLEQVRSICQLIREQCRSGIRSASAEPGASFGTSTAL